MNRHVTQPTILGFLTWNEITSPMDLCKSQVGFVNQTFFRVVLVLGSKSQVLVAPIMDFSHDSRDVLTTNGN